MSKKNLLGKALSKYLGGLVSVGLLLFLPAGTIRFPNAWLLIGVLFVPMLALGAGLLIKSPELLEKRLHTDERESEQKSVILLSVLMFVGGFVAAGLDFRFGLSRLPQWISYAAAVLLILSYALYAEVVRENAFLSRTVEVQENQTVVDTGLYGMVRHPMYIASILLFLSMPLVLGSVYALLLFMIYPFIIVKRIRNEEQVLVAGLTGYADYVKRVRYRLIPFIW